MDKREHCYADGRNVNCQRPLWRSVWCFLKHLKNRATEHMALPLMGVYLGTTKNRQDTGTPKFRAALFTRTSTSVHLKYPRKEKNGKTSCGSYVQWNITQPCNQCHKPKSTHRAATSLMTLISWLSDIPLYMRTTTSLSIFLFPRIFKV